MFMHLALSILVMQCLLPHFLYISLYGTIFLPSSHLRYACGHIGLLVSLTLSYVWTENRFGAMLLFAWLFSIFVHVFGIWYMCGLWKEACAFFMNFMHLEWSWHAWPYPPPNSKDSIASLNGACFDPRCKERKPVYVVAMIPTKIGKQRSVKLVLVTDLKQKWETK